MGERTGIEWCDHSFNPWIGCTKVSAGCANCYAEREMDHRHGRVKWGDAGTRSRTSEKYWREPVKWDAAAKRAGVRRRVFCASLADVFEDRAELSPWRWDLFVLIANTPNLEWLLLTKRPKNILKFWPFNDSYLDFPNVRLMTSIEDQDTADLRIPRLLHAASVLELPTGISAEPLLGPVDLDQPRCEDHGREEVVMATDGSCELCAICAGDGFSGELCYGAWLDPLNGGIQWVIAGGESGPHARPMHPNWARALRDQCAAAGVPFFFKQWGEWDECGERVGKRAAGRLLDGVLHDAFPGVAR